MNRNNTQDKEYTLAYTITDSKESLYRPDGKIFLLDPTTKDSLLLTKRSGQVDSLCFIPHLGLYDAGKYLYISPGNYKTSELNRLLDSKGNLINEAVISFEQSRKDFRAEGKYAPDTMREVLRREEFQGGEITDLCFVPNRGLFGSRSYGNNIFLIIDTEGRVINRNLFPENRWSSCPAKLEYVPNLGVLYTSFNNTIVQGGLEETPKREIRRFTHSKGIKRDFRWMTPYEKTPEDLVKKGFRDRGTGYKCGGIEDICYVPDLGLYAIGSPEYVGLFLCLVPNGKITDQMIMKGKFQELCHVPGQGLFATTEFGGIHHILNEKGKRIPKKDRDRGIKSPGMERISALAAVPAKFYDVVKKSKSKRRK